MQNSYVREFLLEKAIFQLEDKHGPEAEIVVTKRAQLQLFRQWQEPYINAIDKLSEMIERPDAVRLLKPVRFGPIDIVPDWCSANLLLFLGAGLRSLDVRHTLTVQGVCVVWAWHVLAAAGAQAFAHAD